MGKISTCSLLKNLIQLNWWEEVVILVCAKSQVPPGEKKEEVSFVMYKCVLNGKDNNIVA